jgi:cytochrome c-type biogenesis protein CcmH/NrfG
MVLAAGLIAAATYLVLALRRAKATQGGAAPAALGGQSDSLASLDQRARLLIDQLKELEMDRHQLTPESYQAEKTRLELEAADALRARDEVARGGAADPGAGSKGAKGPTAKPPTEAPKGFAQRNPQLMGAVWGGAVVLFFVGIGALLTQEQRPRQDGSEMTGKNPNAGAAGAAADADADRELNAAMERIKKNPQDIELSALVAHELLRRERYDEAAEITTRSAGVDPFHLETKIHRAVLVAVKGDRADAKRQLEELVNRYPDGQEALLFLVAITMQEGDRTSALAFLERFWADAPKEMHPPMLEAEIQRLRSMQGAP